MLGKRDISCCLQGYTIPLDKRLAADGRGLQQVHINENFAKLAEALYIADRKVWTNIASIFETCNKDVNYMVYLAELNLHEILKVCDVWDISMQPGDTSSFLTSLLQIFYYVKG
jgi:hypothetical protein